jgi:hypothetical protein
MFLNNRKDTGVSTSNDSSIVFDSQDGRTHSFLRVEKAFVLYFLSGALTVHIVFKNYLNCLPIILLNLLNSSRMSQGWGFSKETNVKMTTDQVVERKKEAFWEVANDNVIVVPDIDAETEAIQTNVSNPMGLEVEKLVDFYDMQI